MRMFPWINTVCIFAYIRSYMVIRSNVIMNALTHYTLSTQFTSIHLWFLGENYTLCVRLRYYCCFSFSCVSFKMTWCLILSVCVLLPSSSFVVCLSLVLVLVYCPIDLMRQPTTWTRHSLATMENERNDLPDRKWMDMHAKSMLSGRNTNIVHFFFP